MTTKCLLFSVALAVCSGLLWAEQNKALPTKADAANKPAIVQKSREEPTKVIDGDDAYKANCSRCHLPPRKFSERKMATIMQHMRVRANLTGDEADAILGYLTK